MARTGEGDRKSAKSNSRSQRLASALRENLRRRKAQERGRGAPEPSDPSGDTGPAAKDGKGR